MAMSGEKKKKDKFRFRIDVIIFLAIFILVVTFCAYMMNTGLEKTLERERGESIVTHDYKYENSSKTE